MRKTISGLVLASLAIAVPATAEEVWPQRPVTIVVPFSAGGTTDLFGRLVGQHMNATFKQSFVVENRTGAGGSIGTAVVAKAAPDGYTLLVGTASTHAINPFLYTNLAYDTEKAFQAVGLIARLPNMLVVNPKVPAKTVQELIEHLKKNPGKLVYGSSGAGSSTHLAAELFKMRTGTDITHVPFSSSGEVMTNIAGGHIDLAFDNITLAWPQAKGGTARALAVTSPERSASAPDVPALAESFPGFDAATWHGLFAPAGTPRAIVEKISAEVRRILALPEVRAKFAEIGAVPSPTTPDEFTAFVAAEREKWEPVVKASGAKAE